MFMLMCVFLSRDHVVTQVNQVNADHKEKRCVFLSTRRIRSTFKLMLISQGVVYALVFSSSNDILTVCVV